MPSSGGPQDLLIQLAPLLLLFVLFYFMLIRPQQKRAKEHLAMVAGIKRGDNVVLSSGMIGKVVRVEEREVGLEIAQGVTVKVVRTMITEARQGRAGVRQRRQGLRPKSAHAQSSRWKVVLVIAAVIFASCVRSQHAAARCASSCRTGSPGRR